MLNYFNPSWYWRDRVSDIGIKEITKTFSSWIENDTNFIKSTDIWSCNGLTSLGASKNKDAPWDSLVKYIHPLIHSAAESIKKESFNIECKGFWCNKYSKGDYQETHAHIAPDVNLCFCYFYSTNQDCFGFLDSAADIYNASGLPLNPKEEYIIPENQSTGDLLIWPSHYRHFVHLCTGDRITISGNLQVKKTINS